MTCKIINLYEKTTFYMPNSHDKVLALGRRKLCQVQPFDQGISVQKQLQR
jgi:hypothetical protein